MDTKILYEKLNSLYNDVYTHAERAVGFFDGAYDCEQSENRL